MSKTFKHQMTKIRNPQTGEFESMPTLKGADGITPHIGTNGNWWIGDVDTGVIAEAGSGIAASKWSELSEKPFESLSTDFSVENGELKVNGDISDIPIKSIKVNGVEQTPVNKAVDITVPEAVTKTSQLTNDSNFVTNTELNEKGFLTEHQDLSDYALKNEIPKSASDIGAEAEGTAESKVSSHNVSVESHNDIRELITGLTTRLNTLADSDDTTLDQMSEVVAYIKSNKNLIDAITTGKVSVSDIVDNLTTNISNKPLSAAQGVKLKALIDAVVVPTKLSELENDSGYLTEHQDLSGYAKTTDIPKKLPNPQKITFSGAVTAEYDGSGAVTVKIPEGSGGSGETVRVEKLFTDTAVELEPNKLYVFPEMMELSLTFAEPSDTGIVNEYHVAFQSGSSATTLSLPDTVNIPSKFSVEANKIYELSVMENCLTYQSWDVK